MALEILDFRKGNGLVICGDLDGALNSTEVLYCSEIKKLKANAVLFRRFYKSDNDLVPYHSEPAVAIFNETEIPFDSEKHISLHAALWSSGKNEIYILIGKTRADIINARKPAQENSQSKLSISSLKLGEVDTGKSDDRFSAYLFGNGTFWEQEEFNELINEKNGPYIHLLNYLLGVRKKFLDKDYGINLPSATTDKLLIVSILVKFLEEITDDDGKHTLHSIYKKYKIDNFSEAVTANLTIDIFNILAEQFNGKIFDTFSETEKRKIKSADLNLLSQFLSAKINVVTNQMFLWEQYSFNHLPAEIISAIYENFIQEDAKRKDGKHEKGVVYTPIHLVNFLVDEVMPLNDSHLFKSESFKILDPTCGSGVFLVAAYKRLLQWWAINNSSKGNIQYPDSKISQRILQENIFGIDVKETAVLVSILGLTIALLDKLTPKEIWNKLKFNDLSGNITESSFFDWAVKNRTDEKFFDLVIGNPPFNPETQLSKSDVLKPKLLKRMDLKNKIPGNNFALHFFEGSMTLSKKVCMIIPSILSSTERILKTTEQRYSRITQFQRYLTLHI